MKRRTLLWIGLALILFCAVTILAKGSSYTLGVPVGTLSGSADDFRVELEQDREVVRLTERRLDGGTLFLTFRSAERGKAFVDVSAPDGESIGMEVLYVHPFGILSVNTYFGPSSGSKIIPVAVSLYLALILWYVICRYREGMRRSLYQYRNVRNLGWIIYTASLLLGQLPGMLSNDSLDSVVRTTLNATSLLSFVALPVAFVTSILVTLSNL